MGASHFCRNTLTPSCVKNSKFLSPSFPSSPSLDLHLHNWDALNNLAVLHCEMDDFKKAKDLLLESRGILEAKLGTDYPEYANTLTNLAWVYYATGDFQEVETLYREALDICKAKLGKDHPQYATTLNNWAARYYAIGDF